MGDKLRKFDDAITVGISFVDEGLQMVEAGLEVERAEE